MSFTFIIKATGEEITLPTPSDGEVKIDTLPPIGDDGIIDYQEWLDDKKKKQ